MASRQVKAKQEPVKDYRHDAKRKNNPPVGMVSYEPMVREARRQSYAYDPHLSPQLVWAGKAGLNQVEVEEQPAFEVDTVSLHIHERVSTSAIVRAVQRPEPKQFSLFNDPELPLSEAVEFYRHDMNWTNRLILGDSLLVMNSLLQKELMAGKVQMIYLDPPYGIRYASNFQPRVDQRGVKDDDAHLTREPEQIKAYRDTWTLGVHSYLTYLRDRLILCRELLTHSGSIFVQIGDENVHRVRCMMDEVFGSENFCGQFCFKKSSAQTSDLMASVHDHLLWYSREKKSVKYRQPYLDRTESTEGGTFDWLELPDLSRRRLSRDEKLNADQVDGKRFRAAGVSSQTGGEGSRFPFPFGGKTYTPSTTRGWSTNETGMLRLAHARRLHALPNVLCYVRYFDDFRLMPVVSIWSDTVMGTFTEKVYVVQTAAIVVQRCLLMTTDPGDLVLDPTCGSGTTAYVAEQWGRRWITMDTSRVALSLARQRLMTATFQYYELADKSQGVTGGFVYKTVQHITLKSIANNAEIDALAEKYQPQINTALAALNKSAREEWREWEVPRETSEGWNQKTTKAHEEFWCLKGQKQKDIDDSIRRNAPQETLFNEPQPVKGVVRVSGPFTVEAIPPAYVEEEPTFDGDEATSEPRHDTRGAEAHIPTLIELLRKDGLTLKKGQRKRFTTLTPSSGGVLHAEGVLEEGKRGAGARVAVSFGPLYGQVTARQVEDGVREANLGGFDEVVFCGFAFDAAAHGGIEGKTYGHVRALMAHIRPDVLMQVEEEQGKVNLLKTTAGSQLFTVLGEPEVELRRAETSKRGKIKEEWVLKLIGVDLYDPLHDQHRGDWADDVAAWFVDTDYDGRSFCVCQAFFPRKAAWEKLQRALKGTLDEEAFEKLTRTESLPFPTGEHKRAAVKVIDQRGDEVMKVVELA